MIYEKRCDVEEMDVKSGFVRQMDEKNKKIVSEANIEVRDLENWIRELFETGENVVPEMYEWGREEMIKNYIKADSFEERRMVLGKIVHTHEVVKMGLDIAMHETKLNWNMKEVWAVCFLHDLARFQQALLGSMFDEKVNFDHGLVASEMIVEKWQDGFEMPKNEVVEAVRYHSKLEFPKGNQYLELVRDADKAAILVQLQDLFLYWRLPDGKVNDDALRDFVEGRLVRHKFMISKADSVLTYLSWRSDINYEKTRSIIKEEKVEGWCLEKIKEYDEKAWREVKKILDSEKD